MARQETDLSKLTVMDRLRGRRSGESDGARILRQNTAKTLRREVVRNARAQTTRVA